MTLTVQTPGFVTTVQDAGRYGYQRFGVPVSGPMDAFALAAANRLAGNPADMAGLEFAYSGPTLTTGSECLLALTGVGFTLEVDGARHPAWIGVRARAGAVISVNSEQNAGWGYLAVSGGIQTPLVMGSRATYTRAGFGGLEGRMLQAGDVLPVQPCRDAAQQAGMVFPAQYRPAYSLHPQLRVILGPQEDAFTPQGLCAFTGSAYTLTRTADRMGYRLEGARIEHRAGADILSDGMVFGAVQVPSNGQPIVMMSDRQTAGGYTKIAVVIRADLPLLAQCSPGVSQVRFQPVGVDEARQAYREQMAALASGIQQPLEDTAQYASG
jgi:biotin-dependent carboxylase-like uncharacterized protein